ncbi:MAG: transglycosylase SLT domain-containing protein [Methylococcaceae bacterium]
MDKLPTPRRRSAIEPAPAAEPKKPRGSAKKSPEETPIPPVPKKTRKPRTTSKVSAKAPVKQAAGNLRHKLMLIGLEALGLLITAVFAIMVLLGYSANRFSGTGFFDSLLPFAFGVLVLILSATLLLVGWWRLRKCLQHRSTLLMPLLSVSFALLIGWFAMQDQFAFAFGQFRTLVGGKQEAGRVTLTHQVFAAYRRHDPAQLQKLMNRAREYRPFIEEAAQAFAMDVNILQGIAAAESSFLPRDSEDGGHGLFQITLVPKTIMEQAAKRLSVSKLALDNPKHNAFVAAATLKYYLAEMNNDLFLGLLAYNIGPTNGGLRFIMQQYGVTDFVTIQPYLQQLPRDYPIRVLTYALAFRVLRQEGKLLAYEEGRNALRIQRLGVPGL